MWFVIYDGHGDIWTWKIKYYFQITQLTSEVFEIMANLLCSPPDMLHNQYIVLLTTIFASVAIPSFRRAVECLNCSYRLSGFFTCDLFPPDFTTSLRHRVTRTITMIAMIYNEWLSTLAPCAIIMRVAIPSRESYSLFYSSIAPNLSVSPCYRERMLMFFTSFTSQDHASHPTREIWSRHVTRRRVSFI